MANCSVLQITRCSWAVRDAGSTRLSINHRSWKGNMPPGDLATIAFRLSFMVRGPRSGMTTPVSSTACSSRLDRPGSLLLPVR
eukprot:6472121-Amphidinium_carterae.1